MPSSPEALRTTTVNAVSASTSGAWASVSVRITSPRACSAMGSSVVTTGCVGPCHAASWSSRETCVSAGARSMRKARSRTRVSPVAGPVSSQPSGRERRISPRRPLGWAGAGSPSCSGICRRVRRSSASVRMALPADAGSSIGRAAAMERCVGKARAEAATCAASAAVEDFSHARGSSGSCACSATTGTLPVSNGAPLLKDAAG